MSPPFSFVLFQRRNVLAAPIECFGASGVKRAARRQVNWAGHITFQHDSTSFLVQIGDWNSR